MKRITLALPAPYVGLRAFEADDALLFFGREAHVGDLLHKLASSRFTTVIGASGSGKSSLVRAGLIPALHRGDLTDFGHRWNVYTLKPGDSPMANLATALTRDARWRGSLDAGTAPQYLAASLRSGPAAFTDLFRSLQPEFASEAVLLVVDQFEEIFRFRQRDIDEAEAFVKLLLRAAAEPGLPVQVLLTMRADFLGNAAAFHGLPEAINSGLYLTPRLNREQLETVIVAPLALVGGSIDPVLTTLLVNNLTRDDELPVLQHKLLRVWHQARDHGRSDLVFDDFKAVSARTLAAGGLEADNAPEGNALDTHAEEIHRRLSAPAQAIAHALFIALSERRDGRDVRRPQTWSELRNLVGAAAEPQMREVLEAYRAEGVGFLTPIAPAPLLPDTPIDIGHESLIRQWHRLQAWLADEETDAAELQEFEQRRHRWEEKTGGPLDETDCVRASRWRERLSRQPDPDRWARRYLAAPLAAVQAYLAESERLLQEQTRAKLAAEEERIRLARDAEEARVRRLEAEAELQRKTAAAERTAKEQAESGARALRKFSYVLAALLLVVALAAGGAFWAWREAESQRVNLEAQFLWHPLRLLDRKMSSAQFTDLLVLAAADEGHRKAFLEAIRKNRELAGSFVRASADLVAAAAGLDPQIRAWMIRTFTPKLDKPDPVLDRARILALLAVEADIDLNQLVSIVVTTTDGHQLSVLGEGLAAVAGKVDASQAAAVADKFVQAILKTDDPDRLSALLKGLAALPGKLDAPQAAAVVDKVVQENQKTFYVDLSFTFSKLLGINQYFALGNGLAAVAGKLDAPQAAAVVDKFMQAILKTDNLFQLSALVEGLAALPGKLDAPQAAAVVDKFMQAIRRTDDPFQLSTPFAGLAAVAGKLDAPQAKAVVDQLVQMILKTDNSFRLSALLKGLAALSGNLDASQAAAVAQQFVQVILKTYAYDGNSSLGDGLAAVAGKLDAPQAAAFADQLAQTIKKTDDPFRLSALLKGLAALPGKLDAPQAAAFADQLVQTIKKTDDPFRLSALVGGLAALPGKLDAPQAAAVVDKVVQANLTYVQDQNPTLSSFLGGNRNSALGETLAAVAGKLDAPQAAVVADQLVQMILKTDNSFRLSALVEGLAALSGKLDAPQAAAVADRVALAVGRARLGAQVQVLLSSAPPLFERMELDEARTRQWLELCKYPWCPRAALADAVRRQNPKAPAADKGFWAFMDWAAETYRPDLKTPIVFPPTPEKAVELSGDQPKVTDTSANPTTK